MEITEIIRKGYEGNGISEAEAKRLLAEVKIGSRDMYLMMHAANALSRRQFGNRAEIHAQIGLNWDLCSKNCDFCVFGKKHGLATPPRELPEEEVMKRAKDFERAGANAIFLMSTADYNLDRFLSMGRKVRDALEENMPLVANVGDFGSSEASELLDAGFTAIYHVKRLKEGIDTAIDPKDRVRTIGAARKAGLDLSFCVEPIGPEHSAEELVDAIFTGKENGASVMATMRRISIPGTPLHKNGQINEIELARVEAVVRLAMGTSIRAMGVHEPNMLSLLAGGNQIYAETGPNPRDTQGETSEGRGKKVETCRQMLWEAGYETFSGPAESLQGPLRK